MRLPNFVIAGTARSATTSLYYYLRQHPEIAFPSKKEPKYFSSLNLKFPHNGPGDQSVDNSVIRSFESYQKLYEGLEEYKRIGDASSDYLYYHEHTAHAIRNTLGDVPIIICLRNPVDRAFSAYNNLIRDQRETYNFKDALTFENDRIDKNWDWMWAYKAGGLYAAQVETFIHYFTDVKVVLFENLIADTRAVVEDLFAFLDVDRSVHVDTNIRYSHSGVVKHPFLSILTNRQNRVSFALRRIALRTIPRSFMERIAYYALEKEDMDSSIRDELRAFFYDDIVRLEGLLKISLTAWK